MKADKSCVQQKLDIFEHSILGVLNEK